MSEIGNQIKIYSTFYSDLTNLRAAITTIPLIGSQIDLYLSAPGQKYMQERIEYLISQLQEQMNEIYENAIDKRMLDSEEGFDLVNKAFIIAAKTRQKKKLDYLAMILRGAFTKKNNDHDPELYLRTIDELTERELEVALLLYEVKQVRKVKIEGEHEDRDGITNDAYWFSKHYPEYSREELEFILPRLEKTGLVKELVGTFIGYGGGQYNPTARFSDFVNFVQNNL